MFATSRVSRFCLKNNRPRSIFPASADIASLRGHGDLGNRFRRFGSFGRIETSKRSRWWAPVILTTAVGAASISTGLWLYAEPNTNPLHPNHRKRPEEKKKEVGYPVEEAQLAFAPNVPPPIKRDYPVLLKVNMFVDVKQMPIDDQHTYEYWTFNGHVPGPFIRARVGDVLEVHLKNNDMSGMEHNIDFHAVSGPGGGAGVLTCESGETKQGWFKLLEPGLYIYHCAVAPVGVHITNGMYGMILVEPEEGLPKVDKEFYVMQAELYTEPSLDQDPTKLDLSFQRALDEDPTHVVFNGRVGSLSADDNHLQVNTNESVRIYFGNIGPSLISSFHVIGAIFSKVYRDGDLISPPGRSLQAIPVPAGGSTVVEFTTCVPGVYTLVDHSILRIEKGAVGFLDANGPPNPDVFDASHPPKLCEGCKIHP